LELKIVGGALMMAEDPGLTFAKVFEEEKVCIAKQRTARAERAQQRDPARKVATPDPHRHVGLALSGGGVRSASFAIGVLQALHREERLERIDYLSTVSGGGYAGSTLTWFRYLQRKTRASGKESEVPDFPFGQQYRSARAHATGGATGEERTGSEAKADMLSYIRQHGRYLTPARQLNLMALLASVLRNLIVCFSVYFAGLVALDVGLLHLWSKSGALTPLFRALPPWLQAAGPFWWAVIFALAISALSLLFGIGTWLFSRFWSDSNALYRLRTGVQVTLGALLSVALVFTVAGSVQYIYAWAVQQQGVLSGSLSVSSLVGLVGVVWEFYRQQRPATKILRISATARIIITAVALIYALLLGAYAVAMKLVDIPHAGWYAFAYFVVFGLLINSNMFGIGRMYRDRLMEAFMPDAATVTGNEWRPAARADVTFLSDVSTPQDTGPYHLINAHVVLPDTRYARFRNRGGDSFVMSHLFCGGDAIGWHPTSQFCGGEMSLPTAIAISGAAVNPNAAAGGRGVSRDMFVSFMLALFNIRLGYWVRNPHRPPGVFSLVPRWANLLIPGLRQGLLGAGLNRRAHFLELTDGGHFDNTGIYELVRRGVDTIVLSLASADPDFSLADLANVIERVRADFGVYIDFRGEAMELLRPGSDADAIGLPGAKLQISRQGFAVATIYYDQNRTGTLVVLKSTVVRDLPLDVYGYGARSRPFPNESTADQFFGEEQFEAYRELGYYITRRALDEGNAEAWFK
jgi:hypothetical protein